MTYWHRQGVFRSRLILPPSQRALEVFSKSSVGQAVLEFDAAIGNLSVSPSNNQVVSFPLTVAAAVGEERLAILGGTCVNGLAAGGDFDECLIDGQVASRVGTVARAFPATGNGNSSFVTAFRAPGTSNTSINVVATANLSTGFINRAYAACWRMTDAGTVLATTMNNVYDPTLDTAAAGRGALAAGLYGYSATVVFPLDTGFSDGFDRANESLEASVNWTHDGLILNALAVQTNRIRCNVNTTPGSAYRCPDQGTTDHYVQFVPVNTGSSLGPFVACRLADVDNFVGVRVGGGGILNVQRCVAGTLTSLYTSAVGLVSSTDTVRLNVIGSNWQVFRNGISVTTGAIGAVLTSARSGLVARQFNANPWIDSFVSGPLMAVGGDTVAAWTGLTERFDDTTSGNVAFSVASDINIGGAETRAITANVTPDLTGTADATASIVVSFSPVVASTVPALAGEYVITGTEAMPNRFVVAEAGSYVLTGTAATMRRSVVALPGSYALTGTAATPNRSAGATASIVFDAAIADGTDKLQDAAYTFPLTVASATGERLVILGGIAGTDGDFYQVTIDGQAATRVGFVVVGQQDSGGYCAFLTAYRAPGTASTSINVVATVLGFAKIQLSGYCACFRMNGVGALHATTNNNVNDPTLSTDTVSNGAVAAALLGFAAASPPTVVWSGLTERFDSVNTAGVEVFTGASADISSGQLPRPIGIDITPDLTTVGEDSVVSLCLSFLPSGATGTRLAADAGVYAIGGQPAVTRIGFKTTASVAASYAIAGLPATLRTSGEMTADEGSYALTGTAVTVLRGGTSKRLDAASGSYLLVGSDATGLKGRKATVTTVGAYTITGTTVVTGDGLLAVGGSYAIAGKPAGLSLQSGPNIAIGVSSLPMTASTANVTVTGGMGSGVAVTGNQMTMSVGDAVPEAEGAVEFSVTGNIPMLASVGNLTVSVLGGIEVEVIGLETIASVADVTPVIPGSTDIAVTDVMQASVGQVTVEVLGSVNVEIYGNELTLRMGAFDEGGFGDGTVTTGNNISVAGEQMTMTTGVVATISPVTVDIIATGITGTGVAVSLGDVTVTAKQNVTVTLEGNGMVAYVGRLRFVGGGTVVLFPDTTKEGQMLKPSNWMGG